MPTVVELPNGVEVEFPDGMEPDNISQVIGRYSGQLGLPPRFQDRIANPQNYGVINNPDGSISTHRMSAEIDENGQAYAFPMIVQRDGELHQFEDPWEALEWNKANNNVQPFDSINEALEYSKTYKTPEFNEYYEKQRDAFDPAGAGYDHATAQVLARRNPLTIPKPKTYQGDEVFNEGAFEAWIWHPELNDYRKHASSRDPRTGMILKGRNHPTYGLALADDRKLGYEHVEGPGGRYFSLPSEDELQDPIGLAIGNELGR